MKHDNVLGLDLDELWQRRSWLNHFLKTRTILLGVLVLLSLFGAALSAKSLVDLFGHRPFPMYLLEWGQSAEHSHKRNYYHFTNAAGSFRGVDLSRIREIPKSQFEDLILSSTPVRLRPRLERYISLSLKMAEKYQVDPFWVIAVMWTESHFNPEAVSRVEAQGLMQVMPTTGEYLVRKMSRLQTVYPIHKLKTKTAADLPLQDPVLNIEMGSFYLRMLLKQFKGNYRLATVAYNMGPNGVKNRLRKNLPTGVRNLYLNKVQAAYADLTKQYLVVLGQTPRPYLKTFVVSQSLMPKREVVVAEAPLAAFPFVLPTAQKVAKMASLASFGPVSHL